MRHWAIRLRGCERATDSVRCLLTRRQKGLKLAAKSGDRHINKEQECQNHNGKVKSGMRVGMSIWEISLSLANKLYNTANVFLLIGTVLTAASTVIVLWTAGVRDKYASIEIAQAHASSEQAKGTAASAEAAAALAQQRTGELAVLAEQERLKSLRLQEQLAWRVLDQAQVNILSSILSTRKGSIHVYWISGDNESWYYAFQIASVFHKSGWETQMDAALISFSLAFGVVIPDASAPDTQYVRNAFEQAHIEFDVSPYPPSDMSSVPSPKADEVVVFVASKKPPQPGRVTAPPSTETSSPATKPP